MKNNHDGPMVHVAPATNFADSSATMKYTFEPVKGGKMYEAGTEVVVPCFMTTNPESGVTNLHTGIPLHKKVRCPVVVGSGFSDLVRSGHAIPIRISYLLNGLDISRSGMISPAQQLAMETRVSKSPELKGGLLYMNGKSFSGYVIHHKGHALLEELYQQGTLWKELARLAGATKTAPSPGYNITAQVVDENILIGLIEGLDPESFGYDKGDGISFLNGELVIGGEKYITVQTRITDGQTGKGLLSASPKRFAEIADKLEELGELKVPKSELQLILGTTCCKFPKKKHGDVIRLNLGNELRIVMLPKASRGKLPLSGLVQNPQWFNEFIQDLFKEGIIPKDRYAEVIEMIRGSLKGESDSIRKLLLSDDMEPQLLAKVLLGVGPTTAPRVPLLESTVNDVVSTKVPAAYGNHVRKVGCNDTSIMTYRAAWCLDLELMDMRDPRWWHPVMIEGNTIWMASRFFKENLGDFDGDICGTLDLGNGWYLLWRCPTAGLLSWGIGQDISGSGPMPKVLEKYADNFAEEKYWVPEVKAPKAELPTTQEGLRALYLSQQFTGSLGAKLVGMISNSVSRFAMAIHLGLFKHHLDGEHSCKYGLAQERDGIKAMKTNNKGDIEPSTNIKFIKQLMFSVSGGVCLPLDAQEDEEIFTPWTLHARPVRSADWVVDMIKEANEATKAHWETSPLVVMALKTFRDLNHRKLVSPKVDDVKELRQRAKTVAYQVKQMGLELSAIDHQKVASDMLDTYRLMTGQSKVGNIEAYIKGVAEKAQAVVDATYSDNPKEDRLAARLQLFGFLKNNLFSHGVHRDIAGKLDYRKYVGVVGVGDLGNHLDLKKHCYDAISTGMKAAADKNCKTVGDRVLLFAHLGSLAWNIGKDNGRELSGTGLPYTILDKASMEMLLPIWLSGKETEEAKALVEQFDDVNDNGYIPLGGLNEPNVSDPDTDHDAALGFDPSWGGEE